MEKKARKEPTVKQKKAMALALENGGNITKAMRDAGYSEATIHNPSNLTKTATWQELMDTYLPDDTILRALADDIESKPGNRTAELQLAAKMKGKLTDKIDHTTGGEPIAVTIVKNGGN